MMIKRFLYSYAHWVNGLSDNSLTLLYITMKKTSKHTDTYKNIYKASPILRVPHHVPLDAFLLLC